MKFTIVLPTYNRGEFLFKAIESVINQSYKNWELIIVDDGSTDNTFELTKGLCESDTRIKYIYQENKERSAARNTGSNEATGDWVCFLDSDDYYLPNHLTEFNDFIVKHSIEKGVLASGVIMKTGDEEIKKEFLDSSATRTHIEVWEKFLFPTQVCVSKSELLNNKFDEDLFFWEDTNLWLRLLCDVKFYQLKKYTAILVCHDKSSVKQGVTQVRLRNVRNYLLAIDKLLSTKVKDYISFNEFKDYRDSKLKMYLYQARQNKQVKIAIIIWFMTISNKLTYDAILELPKIFVNKLGLGIHD